MTAQLIAVDASALDSLVMEVSALRKELRAANIQPAPKWLTIKAYADYVGKSQSTVNRWISEGTVETKASGGARLVRV